jgi:type I restriction enzyme S subunit
MVWNLNLDQVESDTGRVLRRLFIRPDELGSSTYPFEAGTVLYSKLRPYLNKVVVADEAGYATTELVSLRCDTAKVLPAYIAHFLRSTEFLCFANTVVAGAKMPRMVMSEFWKYKAPIPCLPAQLRIVAILDKANSIRAKRREALGELDRLAQSIFIDMFGEPATNPKNFPRRKLGEIIKFEGGAQPPASTFSDTDGPDKIRLIQIRDFKSDRFKTFIPRILAKRFLEADDVMIGRYGPPVFQILRGLAGSYNVALMKAVPREGITKEFVFHLLKEERLQNFVVANSERTAGQSGVNLSLLENYDAYSPPKELQALFGKQMATLNLMRARMNSALSYSEEMFASLQDYAFQGEL